ncbi:hypothetical protein [Amantichitinum ursilacus]|uniref:Uncharacterized protein n=1 Tax=Amantichitinum ursilacus TaxID=857265 RepID=A0A0N0XG01_9NEIS|nr:hypothetical protein [Amantichitinum ursilacus]KPC49618.1 hypothetical protein WG78_19885 [Amantichitinum ursilacus]
MEAPIGQQKPVNHQKLSFELPGTKESVTWENSASELGYVLYEPLLLDVINNVAYLVVTPKMCAAWRLVGKPNPPYIVFRYMDNRWESVDINVLPSNIAKSNLLVAAVPPDNLLHDKTISDKDINIMNGYIDDSYLKTIYRGKIRYECSEN